jgi:hypothetical protein
MAAPDPKRFPFWLVVGTLALFALAAVYLWRGLASFVATGGNIAWEATAQAQSTEVEAVWATESVATASRLNLSYHTATPLPPCQEFTVIVIRARVRECPGETCETIDRPAENAPICVFRVAPDAPEWYEVNLRPDNPLPQIGYMHNSVIQALYPTRRPTRTLTPTETPLPSATFTPLPTVTTPPTRTPTLTITPLPTLTPGTSHPQVTLTPEPTTNSTPGLPSASAFTG